MGDVESLASPRESKSGGSEPSGVKSEIIIMGGGEVEEDSLEELSPTTPSSSFPRTVPPFRSASFSQVDVTSEGKYVRAPPTPFSLLPNTLPRTQMKKVLFQVGDPEYVDPALDEMTSTTDPCSSDVGGVPRIVREESLPLKSSSSEEGTEPQMMITNTAKAKLAFKLGLHAKLPLLDLDGGGGSSVSGSGGEEEGNKSSNLIRQSSAQSDGSLSDPCASPPTAASSQTLPATKPRSVFRSSGGLSSPPPLSSSSSLGGGGYRYRTLGSPPTELPTRTQSVSSPSPSTTPRGRYYKRPLRGPYGEMLEAEMNKVWSGGNKSLLASRDLESIDFCRESKSSSPPPPPNEMIPLLHLAPPTNKLNSLLMGSLDDINLNSKTNNKQHQNLRARKISTNIPITSTHFHTGEEGGGVLAFHQRTASSPSQLQRTASPSKDGSPRGHVLAELMETEKSYVDSLRILVKNYMEPLKTSDFIDIGLVDEIFFQIPIILWHHERILEALQRRLINDAQSVGDVLLDTFRQTSLLECYALFVNNWKNAKGSLKMAVASKPQLSRFLEANARQHKGKLSIDSLLIMPIQRIPRYELLVKELIKHTQPTHEDHSRLLLALEKIKKFAVHIDCASVDPNDSREIEMEGWSAGLGHLIRQDVVTIATPTVRKERALFLFADSIVVASIKRKSTMRKTSSNMYSTPGGGGASSHHLEGCKFKLLIKVTLPDLHVLSEEGEGCGKGTSPDDLDDLKTIHKIMDLACLLKCNHTGLDESLRELTQGLRHHCDNNVDSVELEIKSPESSGETPPEVMKILFGSGEKKNSWLDSFHDTVGKFIRYGFGRLPQMAFVQALPIRKTRAGLQLSCAAPVSLLGNRVDIWVANSDGYVGQICILTLHPEPAITSCNGVCNSRITCILSVPPLPETPSDDGEESSGGGGGKSRGHKEHWSVWLGTEDGALHLYDCADSVRVKKNKHKVQHKAPLNCMAYYDSRVFVSLGNGDVAMYSRSHHGKGWVVSEPTWITIGSAMNPVTRIMCVSSSLWCVSGAYIKVYCSDPVCGMLELTQTLHVGGDHTLRGVSTLTATEDNTVWVALQSSSVIKCYSNTTYDILSHLDVSPEVSKILSGCDDIIRQHKSACLRITALLVAPDKTLWIGTSAGVILTYNTNGPSKKLTPLTQGHTGQVRFLTSCTSRDSCVVISGGDGYEEFRPGLSSTPAAASFASTSSSSSTVMETGDLSGREDSTNHLLIWRLVPKMLPC